MSRPAYLDSRLKHRCMVFLAASLYCSVLFSWAVYLARYASTLEESLKVVKSPVNAEQMRKATDEIAISAERVKALIPAGIHDRVGEDFVLAGVDTIKASCRGYDVTVEDFDTKGEEVVLPLRISAKSGNYTEFTNNVGFLQSMSFPFFSIKEISISQAESEKGQSVAFEINGALKTMKNTTGK